MRRLAMLLATVVVFLAARASPAGEIDIRTLDDTPWARLVQQIQDDVASQGGVFPVLVFDGSTPIPCGAYELRPDAVTAAAFQVGACDPRTDATALRLVRRAALFEAGEVVPRARKASLGASVTRRGQVEGGGAPPRAGSKVWCTVALQPYLWDGLRGEPTPLTPDRFVLVPHEAYIHAAPDGSGWIARGESRLALRFHYEVDDLHTGTKVLENEATLACADPPAASGSGADTSAYDAWTNPHESRPSGGVPALSAAPPPVDMSAYDAWNKASNSLPWWIALDLGPHPVTASFVGTMLIRPVSDIVLPGGVRGSTIYGAEPAVYGGSTVGVSVQHGMLFFPARFTVAGDANALVLSGFTGLGVGWSVLDHTSVYAAPALRYTAMAFSQGWFNQLDGALLVGVRRRFWGSRKCANPKGGFEAFLEAAAPIASSGMWFVSGGVTTSWGPGGGYPWFISLARCNT